MPRTTAGLGSRVQRRQADPGSDVAHPADVGSIAAEGVAGGGGTLPHIDQIQDSFGSHDVSGINAHVGSEAASAASAIGAEAYATGNDVAFASSPTVFVAAHEAAHVVQQRAGVSLLGGVGEAGDTYEQQADAVAERVVRGESAEDLLGPSGNHGVSTKDVQRQAAPSVPNTSRELEVIVFERGATTLKITVITTWGETAAAGGSAQDVGPIDEASWSVLEPKMVTEANSLGLRLEAALINAEFELDVFEGFSLALELTGPEGSFDLDNGADLSLAEIALKAKADVLALGGVKPPSGASLTVAIEGSFTIGGKLLAKLAEMAERATRIAAKADELAKIADDLAKAAALDTDLSTRRKNLVAFRDALGWEDRAARADFDKMIRALDVEIADNRGRIHASASQSAAMQREISDEAKKLTALEKKLDGRIGRKFARRISGAAAKKIGRALAKLIPVLNLVSTVADVVAVIELFAEWAEHDFDLPNDGDGNPLGEISWKEEGDGGTGDEAGDVAPHDEGAPDAGQEVDGDDGGTAEPGSEPAPDPAARSDQGRPPEPGGDVPVTVPDQLHGPAKAVLDVIEGEGGVRLDEAQVRALERIVPATLGDEELVSVLQALIELRDELATNDAHEVLAAVDQAVRDLHEPTVRVSVDGEDRPDLGSQPAADEAALDETDSTTREDGSTQDDRSRQPDDGAVHEPGAGDESGDEGARTERDLAMIVFHLPESVLESWLSFERGLEADGFEVWRDANVGMEIPGNDGWELSVADLQSQRSSEDDSWWVVVTFVLVSAAARESPEHHFFVRLGEDGRPVAERVVMFTVKPG